MLAMHAPCIRSIVKLDLFYFGSQICIRRPVFVIFNRKNVIVILMSIELILLSVNINMVAFSVYLQNITGQIFTLFILTVAAAEAAIGLAILVVFFRNRGSIQVEDINSMKG
jgi:NADH-quinone oxidoreductase subunit K